MIGENIKPRALQIDGRINLNIPKGTQISHEGVALDYLKMKFGPQFYILYHYENETKINFVFSANIFYPIQVPNSNEPIYYEYNLEKEELGTISVDKIHLSIIEATKRGDITEKIKELRDLSVESLAIWLFNNQPTSLDDFFLTKLNTTPLRRLILQLIIDGQISISIFDKHFKYLDTLRKLEFIVQIDSTDQDYQRFSPGDTLLTLLSDTSKTHEQGLKKGQIGTSEYFDQVYKKILSSIYLYYERNDKDRLRPFSKIPFEILALYYEYCIFNLKLIRMTFKDSFHTWCNLKAYTPNTRKKQAFYDYLVIMDHMGLITVNLQNKSFISKTNTYQDLYNLIEKEHPDFIVKIKNREILLWNNILLK